MREKESNRDRQHEVKVRLNDEELKYLNGMVKATDMRSREQFIRQLIMYGNIYEVDYSFLKENNYQISRLGHKYVDSFNCGIETEAFDLSVR